MRVAKEYSIRNEEAIKIISFLPRTENQSTVAQAPSVSDWGVSPPFPLQHSVLQACLTVEADGVDVPFCPELRAQHFDTCKPGLTLVSLLMSFLLPSLQKKQ